MLVRWVLEAAGVAVIASGLALAYLPLALLLVGVYLVFVANFGGE